MDDAEVDRQIEETERAEAAKRAAEQPILRAAGNGDLGTTFAGVWRDNDLLVVAVTREPAAMAAELERISPEAQVTIVLHEHSQAELERLADEVFAEIQRQGARMASLGVDVTGNRVDVMFPDLAAPAVQAVMRRFAGRPVVWDEGEIYAASRMASSSRSIESRSSAELSTRRTSAGVIPTRSAVSRNGVGAPPPLMP